jgi:hypothetical protein
MAPDGDKITVTLLHLRTQLKVFHWQTTSYAEHKALDWLQGRLLELNDRWVEAYQGSYPRIRCGGCSLQLYDWIPGAARVYVTDRARSIEAHRNTNWSAPEDSFLANILDEIVAALSKGAFLLTLQ